MLPQLKLISLIVRVFARPIITSKKDISIQKAQLNKNHFMTQQIENLGNAYHQWDQKIDRLYMDQNLQDEYEKLDDQEALILGTECLFEIVIYAILIVVSAFEIYKTYCAQYERQQNINQTISVI